MNVTIELRSDGDSEVSVRELLKFVEAVESFVDLDNRATTYVTVGLDGLRFKANG